MSWHIHTYTIIYMLHMYVLMLLVQAERSQKLFKRIQKNSAIKKLENLTNSFSAQ